MKISILTFFGWRLADALVHILSYAYDDVPTEPGARSLERLFLTYSDDGVRASITQ